MESLDFRRERNSNDIRHSYEKHVPKCIPTVTFKWQGKNTKPLGRKRGLNKGTV